jgi:hypothetical protein
MAPTSAAVSGARRCSPTATRGKISTESTPAPTSAADVAGTITPSCCPISAKAMSSGSEVAVMNVISTRCLAGSTRRYTSSDGRPRTISSIARSSSSRSGSWPIAFRSMVIPDETKKIGMKIPYPTVSNLRSRPAVSTPSRWVQMRSTIPASIAPSTTSRPNLLATASSRNSSSTAQRSVICPVASWPSLMIRRTVPLPASHGTTDSAMASTPTRATEASATKCPRLVRNTAMIRMGNSSPTAPAAYTYRPNCPPSMSLSRRMGSRVPSAVVVSARPTGM